LEFINSEAGGDRRQIISVQLPLAQAACELEALNRMTIDHLKSMLEEIDSIRQDEDNSKQYDHPLF